MTQPTALLEDRILRNFEKRMKTGYVPDDADYSKILATIRDGRLNAAPKPTTRKKRKTP